MASAAAIQVLPDKMAVFNRSLLENLASLKPMAQLAIPIIELLNDAADVFDFHEFFQVSTKFCILFLRKHKGAHF
jgi:hypothetical protein